MLSAFSRFWREEVALVSLRCAPITPSLRAKTPHHPTPRPRPRWRSFSSHEKASVGLLLGAVRAAHRSGKEADRLLRDAERAAEERAKLKGLLDTAINDKRKV